MTGCRYQLGCMLLLGLFAAQAGADDAPVWLRDLDAGKADAKVAGKDLFLLFTGVGWCKPCMDFDRKVLKQPAFLDQVRKSEELAVDPSGWTMTHVAECHFDLGDADRAQEWLDRAEAEAAKLKASPRQGDQQMAGRVEKRIKELRERLKGN